MVESGRGESDQNRGPDCRSNYRLECRTQCGGLEGSSKRIGISRYLITAHVGGRITGSRQINPNTGRGAVLSLFSEVKSI